MAPNSLFAVLLRSPWWISIAIAAGFTALAYALLPPQWAPFMAAGALPFVVIGGIALKRQWSQPSAAQTEAVLQRVGAMSWTEFSALLSRAFERQGWRAGSAPAGADLLIERGGRRTLVAAKRWKAARHGEEALQALRTAAQAIDASGCAYVMLGELSPQARRFADTQSIEIIQGRDLAQLVRKSLPA